MAVNPMQRKARNSFLLGVIITLLIGRKRSMDNIDLFFCNSFCRNVSEC